MDIRKGTRLPGPNGDDILVDELLGQGGLGQVFSGVTDRGMLVAIKTMLTGGLDPSETDALRNEGRLAVGIVHPNVVHVLHFADGSSSTGIPPYLVMERIDGVTLDEYLDNRRSRGEQLSESDLRAMYLAIADGMEAVNARLVHRDLKPSNVLIESATGTLKVADFGLAKLAVAATRTDTFKGWGTPPYMAPEAWDHGPNTVAMDIYAAGVLFFEMATFSLPIEVRPQDPAPIAWRNAHLLVPAKNVQTFRPDLSLEMRQLLTKMLQKDPRKRPASWSEVRASLSRPIAAATIDVSNLVKRAVERVEAEEVETTRKRAEYEAAQERFDLLQSVYGEPLQILEEVVAAVNAASDLVNLILVRTDDQSVTVYRADNQKASLHVHFRQIDDLDLGTKGIVRIIGVVELSPEPRATKESDYFDKDSFGGFNLIYRVREVGDKFGDWEQIRFEMSPISMKMRYPHWWAHKFVELPRELQLLNAAHVYQSQRRSLDSSWFEALLASLV